MSQSSFATLDTEYQLSSGQISAYQRDGFIVLPKALDSEEVAACRACVTRNVGEKIHKSQELDPNAKDHRFFVQIMHLWESDPALAYYSLARRFGKIVADLMGVDVVRMYHDQVLFKEPGGARTPWHQDQYYIPLDTDRVLTMWLPLVDVSAEMGTMSFIPGSNRHPSHNLPTSRNSDEYFGKLIEENHWPVFQSGALGAGDASFHAGWTIHCAEANSTKEMREVFNIVYFADGARVVEQGAWKGAVSAHLQGRQPGQLADSDINPVVFARR